MAFSPKPSEAGRSESVKWDGNHRPEDSYEAALRAADALFAPAKKAVDADVAARDGYQDVEGLGELPSKGGGRILRVIDEPPSEALVAMEEVRVPKRRGRKPGSKNKPKPFPAVGAGGFAASNMPATAASSAAVERQRALKRWNATETGGATSGRALSRAAMLSSREAADMDVTDFETSGPAVKDPRPSASEAFDAVNHGSEALDLRDKEGVRDKEGLRDEREHDDAVPAAPRRTSPQVAPRPYRRFSWIRTKLKPGQEWKRRLPKICW